MGVGIGSVYVRPPTPASCSLSAGRRVELDEELKLRTAEHVAERLGHMKGALMKIGQMASYLDDGLPEPVASRWPSCSRTRRR